MELADHIGRRLKLREIHVFLAVVEAGSMVRAAERLSVSQPVVSKTIADLELVLGVPLFDRTHRGVEPTEFGRALVGRGVAVFDELRQAARDIEMISDPSAGEVRISGADAMIAGLLPYAIAKMHRSHPRLVFQVLPTTTGAGYYDDLRQRRVDFAIGRAATRDSDTDLTSEVLFYEKLCIATGVDTTVRERATLADLRDEKWVLPHPDTEVGAIIAEAFRLQDCAPPRATIFCNSTQMIFSLMRSGRFFTTLPSSLFRFSEQRHWVQVVPVEFDAPPRPVTIVTVAGRRPTAAAELFIGHLRSQTFAPSAAID